MKHLIILALLLIPTTASAQALTLTEGVTQAILDMTTTERRHLQWRPCGERFRGRDPRAHAYAERIAEHIVAEAGEDLDPWWMAAQLMQESGMNPCIFSSREFAVYRRALGHRPDERDIMRLLRRPALRQQHGIRAMDGGLAQFRWPGVAARRYGISEPAQLLDVAASVRAFASALRGYRAVCATRADYRGTHTWVQESSGVTRVRQWNYSCDEVFWAIHNTGDRNRVRYEYIRNVRRRYQRGPAKWRNMLERGQVPEGDSDV